MMNVYDAIKKVANQKGYSVRYIEQELNISNGTIGKWNESSPSVYSLKKVSDFLGVDVSMLIDLSDEKATIKMNDEELLSTLSIIGNNPEIRWELSRNLDTKEYLLRAEDDEGSTYASVSGQENILTFFKPEGISESQMKAIVRFAKTPEKDKWTTYKPVTLTLDEALAIARNCFINSKVDGRDFYTMNRLIHKVRVALDNKY